MAPGVSEHLQSKKQKWGPVCHHATESYRRSYWEFPDFS